MNKKLFFQLLIVSIFSSTMFIQAPPRRGRGRAGASSAAAPVAAASSAPVATDTDPTSVAAASGSVAAQSEKQRAAGQKIEEFFAAEWRRAAEESRRDRLDSMPDRIAAASAKIISEIIPGQEYWKMNSLIVKDILDTYNPEFKERPQHNVLWSDCLKGLSDEIWLLEKYFDIDLDMFKTPPIFIRYAHGSGHTQTIPEVRISFNTLQKAGLIELV